MTTPPSGSPPSNEYSLNQIKGIGPTRQQQLQTLLAIATVLDLAAAEAAAIESAFRDAGYPITRSNAAAWIAQARQLIEAETRQQVEPRTQQADKTIFPAPDHLPAGEAMAEAEKVSADAIAEEWQTQATVLLEFQTHGEEAVHRWRLFNPVSKASLVLTDQASDSLRAWVQHVGHVFFHLPEDEHVSDSLRAWFQQQIPVPPPPPPLPPPQLPPPERELIVQVRQVMLLQPPETSLPIVALAEDAGFPGSLQANQPFQVGVGLEFPELVQRTLPSDVSYSLEGFAKTLNYPHLTIPLGKSPPRVLTNGQTQYQTAIAATALPSGLYRLQILIAFQGVDIPLAIHEISRLQVI
ncbi:hypothetical protein VB780_05530 [Leptolyngbya sp. CCNP1308]|uniref:hypothetical protein n=1 Tax=Leptolyngbya sp. CCNP1308 TaxID=3110255 RepID=UPI002B1F6CAA|nr:hypothetical protein [Leptolyngbya sp. CCNP1308]MEA5448021.1 hypothetical protein [Leptolyngbya sp. CCNP1308]